VCDPLAEIKKRTGEPITQQFILELIIERKIKAVSKTTSGSVKNLSGFGNKLYLLKKQTLIDHGYGVG
jgi:hypothetical protein